jgi:hypothetical protein
MEISNILSYNDVRVALKFAGLLFQQAGKYMEFKNSFFMVPDTPPL